MQNLIELTNQVLDIIPDGYYETIPPEVKNLCKSYGYCFLGMGSYRVVFKQNNRIYKVSYQTDNQNIRQFETWQKLANNQLRQYFQPCINLSNCGKVLECKYIPGKTLTDFYYSARPEKYNSLWYKLEGIKYQIKDQFNIDLWDLRDENVLYNKDLVIIDF